MSQTAGVWVRWLQLKDSDPPHSCSRCYARATHIRAVGWQREGTTHARAEAFCTRHRQQFLYLSEEQN